jgi:hypothetical protein
MRRRRAETSLLLADRDRLGIVPDLLAVYRSG